MRRLPGPAVADWAKEQNSGGSLRIVSGLAENTNSIICEGSSEPDSKWMSGSAWAGATRREARLRYEES